MSLLAPNAFVLGLFVYLRQAALSLHRCELIEGSSFKDFYSGRDVPPPKKVIHTLKELERNGTRSAFHLLIALFSKRRIWLRNSQLQRIYRSLDVLEALWDSRVLQPERRSEVRLELSRLSESLRKKLPRTLARRGDYVEHLNQNETLQLSTFRELVGDTWPR